MKKRIIISIIIDLLVLVAFVITHLFVLKLDFTAWYFVGPVAVLASIFVILLCVLGLIKRVNANNQKMKEQVQASKKLIDSLEANTKYIQEDLPIGIIMYSEKGIITFANVQAKLMLQSSLIGKDIAFVSRELNEIVKTKKTSSVVSAFGKQLRCELKILQRTLYLRDVTDEVTITEEAKLKAPSIMILSLDNTQESIEDLNLQRKTDLLGQYYAAIESWQQKYNLFSLSVDDEKHAFVVTKKELDLIIQERFSIIETIDQISKERGTGISISVGVGIGSDDYQQLGYYAQTALDLAQGRGGDQAVIYNGETETAFGGNVQFSERTSKQETRAFSKSLVEVIKNASSVIVMPHTDTDADAIGSALGVLEMSLACGTPAKVLIDEDKIDSTVKKIIDNSEHEFIKLRQFLISPQDVNTFFKGRTLLIIVDHHSKDLSVDKAVYNKANQVVIIDHHRLTERLDIEPTLQYIDHNASSAVELITEFIQLAPIEIKIPNFVATIMLIGTIIDTNNFVNHTTYRTFNVAALLTEFGADTHEAKRYLRQSVQEQADRVSLLQKAEIIYEHYAIIVDPSDIVQRDMLSKTADALLNIDNVEASFSIGKISKDTVSVSARSNKVNVHIIMEKLNGGGHFNAAGAQIKNATVEEVYSMLVNAIKDTLRGKGEYMKVILIEDVKKQGKKGDIIDVQTGFGNYLLSRHLAIEANASNIAALEEQRENEERRIEEEMAVAKKLKDILETTTVKVTVKTGSNGKLFGSVSTKEIADALMEQKNINVDKRKIMLPDEKITALGTYQASARLYKDVMAKFNIEVIDGEGK
ncbi:MAG: 50S ribosomal protein L9 [Gammaproteobacteria bacterium]|nr:50S ribosomal protein L9 [Gammaproteobacteria bacterium]